MLLEESEELGFQKAMLEEKKMTKHCEGYISLISALEPGKVRLIIDVPMDAQGYFADDGIFSFEVNSHVEVTEL